MDDFKNRLLIVDEAENLPYRALEITRRIHDKTGVGVLLIGRSILLENLKGYNNQYDQLYSRVKYTTMEMTETMKKDNQFFGDFLQKEEPKNCAIMSQIKNRIMLLESELDKAKVRFADATLDKENWSMAKEREIDCKVLEGQISILNKMQNEFETMLAPVMQPS